MDFEMPVYEESVRSREIDWGPVVCRIEELNVVVVGGDVKEKENEMIIKRKGSFFENKDEDVNDQVKHISKETFSVKARDDDKRAPKKKKGIKNVYHKIILHGVFANTEIQNLIQWWGLNIGPIKLNSTNHTVEVKLMLDPFKSTMADFEMLRFLSNLKIRKRSFLCIPQEEKLKQIFSSFKKERRKTKKAKVKEEEEETEEEMEEMTGKKKIGKKKKNR
jgi:hypothetical protein